MSPGAKMEYLKSIYLRYKRACRNKKSKILDEFCLNCCYHRKHAIRLLKQFKRFSKPKLEKRGKPSNYNKPEIIQPLKIIWFNAHMPCSKRLKAVLPLWLPYYAQEFTPLSISSTKALLKISPATIDRLLQPVRLKYKTHGRSTTKPGTLLKKHIPIKTNQWDESRPGFVEADTVVHCGDSLLGQYAFTLDIVDIATGWTEQRAIWGKGQFSVFEQIKNIENSLPFDLLGFDSDNGSEFLNWHLFKYFELKTNPSVQFTRSREYKKDDNAHIEQKNWTHVRQWLGYHRLDNPNVIPLMNDLYTKEWRLFHNFFCPSVKLIEKKRIASKTFKRYDNPKTPFQRLLDSKFISAAVKRDLNEQFKGLNPFQLRKAMNVKLNKIFSVQCKKSTSVNYALR